MGYGECLKCKFDIGGLINFDHLCDEFIICPNCGNKMTVEFDEYYDSESGEDSESWWVEQYEE